MRGGEFKHSDSDRQFCNKNVPFLDFIFFKLESCFWYCLC